MLHHSGGAADQGLTARPPVPPRGPGTGRALGEVDSSCRNRSSFSLLSANDRRRIGHPLPKEEESHNQIYNVRRRRRVVTGFQLLSAPWRKWSTPRVAAPENWSFDSKAPHLIQ